MKIGKIVQRAIPAIFDYCEKHPEEFTQLQDPDYSKKTFNVYFPFCRAMERIEPKDTVRYWRQTYVVRGVTVRVTSQWASNRLDLFTDYLRQKGISPQETVEYETPPLRASYKSFSIGKSGNGLVRYLLGQIKPETFTKKDWLNVIEEFEGKCAYLRQIGGSGHGPCHPDQQARPGRTPAGQSGPVLRRLQRGEG
ncbi:hypothetical protein [Paenirhodobacter sp.]|uniref:hypothetical protein n=1 Tax=Paenirhodobacter sp. TaxID=1965326 RepID=UPI003B40199B